MPVSLDDLRALDWQRLRDESASGSCEDLHRTLSAWLRTDEVPDAAKATWLAVEPMLAIYIEHDLDAESPFHPSNLYDSITGDMLRALIEVVEPAGSADLRARVLDLAWARRACEHAKAAAAVQMYIAAAEEGLDPKHWLHAFSRFKRAIELATSLGAGHPARLEAIAAIESAIARIHHDDPLFLTLRLMGLLLHFRAGDATAYADLAHAMAERARLTYESHGVGNGLECDREQEALEVEIRWRRRTNQPEPVRRLGIEVADAFERRADGIVAAKWPSAKSVAVSFLGSAIERLRQVGGEGERVDALRLRQQLLQREALSEMRPIGGEFDVTDDVKAAKSLVSDKPAMSALVALAFFRNPPTIADLQEEVRMGLRDSPFRALVPQSFLGPRGTVLAEHAGVLQQDDDTGFRLETMRIAHGRQASLASVVIHSAAEQIRLEHGLDARWFIGMCHASSFVPAGRERSFGRGLAAGLRGDYELAASLLYPQFEHAIRELFLARGIVTSTLPSSGAQNELTLNQLLEHPRAIEVLGEELTFDLRVLLTEKAGANLRNDLAHGLLDDGAKVGAKIYLWWMCLRLVLIPLAIGGSETTPPNSDIAEDANSDTSDSSAAAPVEDAAPTNEAGGAADDENR